VNLAEPVTIHLHPNPQDGARFALNDVAGNLSTYNVTLDGNGQRIESAVTLTLSTDNTNSEWFYRADTGNWVLFSPLILTDTFPYPEEFDDFFIIMLAMRLNPAYGTTIDGQIQSMLSRATRQMKARYSNKKRIAAETALFRLSKIDPTRDAWNYYDETWGDDNAIFNRGYPW
jgi:hypothetical protein